MEQGTDINKECHIGNTPLFEICWCKRNIDSLNYIVEYGTDINKVGYLGETPLHRTYNSGNELVVKYLVERGADLNKKKPFW